MEELEQNKKEFTEDVKSIENFKNNSDLDVKKTEKKRKKMTDYRVGGYIYNYKIKKVYFADNDRKFIILKLEDNDEVTVFGETPKKIVHLLAECNYLTKNFVKNKKNKEMLEYQRAVAINTYLIGEEEKSKEILDKLLNKLQEKIVLRKKLSYIGVYLIIIIIMIGVCATGGFIQQLEQYMKYVKIATFGSFGGFIALNVKLKDIKFDISESTLSYIMVSLYKLVFSMISSIISYFFIESELILSAIKNNSNSIYLIYTIATLAGFSESLLPSIFKNLENNTVDSGKSKSE